MTITPKDIARFCAAKGVKSECPYCGAQSWAVIPCTDFSNARYGEWAIGSTPDDPARNDGYPSLKAVALACNNCHAFRFHGLPPIEKWLNENPEGEKNNG